MSLSEEDALYEALSQRAAAHSAIAAQLLRELNAAQHNIKRIQTAIAKLQRNNSKHTTET